MNYEYVNLDYELNREKKARETLKLDSYLKRYYESKIFKNGKEHKIGQIRLKENFSSKELEKAIDDIHDQVKLLGTNVEFTFMGSNKVVKKELYGFYSSDNKRTKITDFEILVNLLNLFYNKEKSKMISSYNKQYIIKCLEIINILKAYLKKKNTEKEQSNSKNNKLNILNIPKKNIELNELEKKFKVISQRLFNNKEAQRLFSNTEENAGSFGGKKPVKKTTTKKTVTTKKPVKKTTTKKPVKKTTTKKPVKKTTTKKTTTTKKPVKKTTTKKTTTTKKPVKKTTTKKQSKK